MAASEDDRDRARRDALLVAAELGRPCPDPTAPLERAAHLLARWRTDDGIRAVLRPVFEAAVPDQRALIALGDIDAWLPDGRTARDWWEQAVDGPDHRLAAEAAYRVGLAHRRGGRRAAAEPFLRRAAVAGITGAANALRRSAREEAAEIEARRVEDLLALADRCLAADDPDGAEVLLRTVSRPGGPVRSVWEHTVRGELAFRRGDLDGAAEHYEATSWGWDDRPARLRLAQIAILRGDARGAFDAVSLADLDDGVGEEARPLLALHAGLIAAGAPVPDVYCDCCCECCCGCEDAEDAEDDDED